MQEINLILNHNINYQKFLLLGITYKVKNLKNVILYKFKLTYTNNHITHVFLPNLNIPIKAEKSESFLFEVIQELNKFEDKGLILYNIHPVLLQQSIKNVIDRNNKKDLKNRIKLII